MNRALTSAGSLWAYVRTMLEREKRLLLLLLALFLVMVLARSFVVRSFVVPTSSMAQTLEIQDKIMVDQLSPAFKGLHRGEIIVFRDPGNWLGQTNDRSQFDPVGSVSDWGLSLSGVDTSKQYLVKRLIGLPGDLIQCEAPCRALKINGVEVSESYLSKESVDASNISFDVVVPDNAIWVMGDNRVGSSDSRSHMAQPGGGFVPLKNVVGSVFAVFWPLDRIQLISHDGTNNFNELSQSNLNIVSLIF